MLGDVIGRIRRASQSSCFWSGLRYCRCGRRKSTIPPTATSKLIPGLRERGKINLTAVEYSNKNQTRCANMPRMINESHNDWWKMAKGEGFAFTFLSILFNTHLILAPDSSLLTDVAAPPSNPSLGLIVSNPAL